MVEDHTLRTEECEVEPHRWGWLLVWTTKPNIIELNISSKVNMCYVFQWNFVIEMRILNLIIDLYDPTIPITPNSGTKNT